MEKIKKFHLEGEEDLRQTWLFQRRWLAKKKSAIERRGGGILAWFRETLHGWNETLIEKLDMPARGRVFISRGITAGKMFQTLCTHLHTAARLCAAYII